MGLSVEDEGQFVTGAGVVPSARRVGASGGEDENQDITDAGVAHPAKGVGTRVGEILTSTHGTVARQREPNR